MSSSEINDDVVIHLILNKPFETGIMTAYDDYYTGELLISEDDDGHSLHVDEDHKYDLLNYVTVMFGSVIEQDHLLFLRTRPFEEQYACMIRYNNNNNDDTSPQQTTISAKPELHSELTSTVTPAKKLFSKL